MNDPSSLWLILILLLYFLPTFIAFGRSEPHKNRFAILILNLFLGWSGLGWIAALVWSFTKGPQAETSEVVVSVPSPPKIAADPNASVADELTKLAQLRDSGVLTDEEFETQKERLLRNPAEP